jgi:hypothetical protein
MFLLHLKKKPNTFCPSDNEPASINIPKNHQGNIKVVGDVASNWRKTNQTPKCNNQPSIPPSDLTNEIVIQRF